MGENDSVRNDCRDLYKPGYHFVIENNDGRPGDPNGMFFANGEYHLMFLYRKDKNYCWGHVSSRDLIHWQHHPDALKETVNDNGCFSGGAFVDEDGTAYLSYWIFNKDGETAGFNAGIGLAKSCPPYDVWTRLPNAVIPSTEWGIREVDGAALGCADPSNIWKENGTYYMQTGNLLVLEKFGRSKDSPVNMRGDWTELFSSKDLLSWHYEGRFYQRRADNSWTDESEDDMCPSYLPLPPGRHGGAPTGKMLQLFIAHNKGCQYYIGRQEGLRFIPEKHGRMTWVDNSFFAPEACVDDRGRQIMFAWLLDNLKDDYEKFGWSGVYGLPRALWLAENGELGLAPADEVYSLREGARRHDDAALENGRRQIEAATPQRCMLRAEIDMSGAARAGFRVRESADGQSYVSIYYDAEEKALVFDALHSGTEGRCARESAPLTIDAAGGEKAVMEVFIDQAVIEVFVNERQAITRRIFNANPKPTVSRYLPKERRCSTT